MYEEVLKACKEWYSSIHALYADELITKIDTDNEKAFIANIDSKQFLSQFVVSEPDCRPYRYVELTIMDISKDTSDQPVFWYGDKEGDTIVEIINSLNTGLKILLYGSKLWER